MWPFTVRPLSSGMSWTKHKISVSAGSPAFHAANRYFYPRFYIKHRHDKNETFTSSFVWFPLLLSIELPEQRTRTENHRICQSVYRHSRPRTLFPGGNRTFRRHAIEPRQSAFRMGLVFRLSLHRQHHFVIFAHAPQRNGNWRLAGYPFPASRILSGQQYFSRRIHSIRLCPIFTR